MEVLVSANPNVVQGTWAIARVPSDGSGTRIVLRGDVGATEASDVSLLGTYRLGASVGSTVETEVVLTLKISDGGRTLLERKADKVKVVPRAASVVRLEFELSAEGAQ